MIPFISTEVCSSHADSDQAVHGIISIQGSCPCRICDCTKVPISVILPLCGIPHGIRDTYKVPLCIIGIAFLLSQVSFHGYHTV